MATFNLGGLAGDGNVHTERLQNLLDYVSELLDEAKTANSTRQKKLATVILFSLGEAYTHWVYARPGTYRLNGESFDHELGAQKLKQLYRAAQRKLGVTP